MPRPDADPVRFRRFLPAEGTVTAAEAVRDVVPDGAGAEDRPYVVLNMVATADGRAAVSGQTSQIGNRADRELFHQLRTRTDAVMAGAGTVRAERYRRLVRDPELRAQRERDGLRPDPLAVIVSGRLDLPSEDVPLLGEPEQTVAILTSSERVVEGALASIDYLRSAGETLDFASLLSELGERHGIRSILCEGGPTLNGALLAEGLVDELFLSLAPKIAGGPDPLTIVEGSELPDPADMELTWLLESGGHLFLRYRLRP
ncbi:MAG: RibD family protein [Solirubrobacteraceae bacterium]